MPNIISHEAKISTLADIEESIKGSKLIIGAGCHIDAFVKIKFTGGIEDIEMGENCYINSGTVIYSGNGVKMGDYVLIGPNCSLVPVNHNIQDKNTVIRLQGFQPSKGGIVIEDDVWLGAGVCVLDGAIIRKGCVVAANSVLTGDTEEYGVYVGSPAKLIKKDNKVFYKLVCYDLISQLRNKNIQDKLRLINGRGLPFNKCWVADI